MYCKPKCVWALFLNQLRSKFYFGQAKTCLFIKDQPVSVFGIAYMLHVQKRGLVLFTKPYFLQKEYFVYCDNISSNKAQGEQG